MTLCTAGGLFSTQHDVNRAIDGLHENGFQEAAFTVIGREGGAVRGDAPRETPTDMLSRAFRTGGSDRLRRVLNEMGCTPEEAHFYTRGVKDGQLLLLVHNLETERLRDAYRVLREFGARVPQTAR